MGDRGQTSAEYLLLVAVGVLLAIIAVAGLFHIGKIVYDEYNRIAEYQDGVVRVLLT